MRFRNLTTAFSTRICAIAFLSMAPTVAVRAQDRDSKAGDVEKRLQGVYEKLSRCTVKFGYGEERKLQFGSGVIVSSEGHVVVSGPVHAALDNSLLELRLCDGRRVAGEALGWSSEFGFGMLKITEAGPWPYCKLAARDSVKPGNLCVAVGYPSLRRDRSQQFIPELRLGSVTRVDWPTWLTTSHRFLAGAYGVFDLDGSLLGLCCSTPVGDDPRLAGASLVERYWEQLVAGKNLDRERLFPGTVSKKQQVFEEKELPDTPPASTISPDVLETAISASVRIRELDDEDGLASGTIVSSDGLIVTCGHHRRMPGHVLRVSLVDGRDAQAVVLGTNLITDIGLLKITDGGSWPFVSLGSSTILKAGEPCVAIGFPRARPGREPLFIESHIIQSTQKLKRRDDFYCQFWTHGYPRGIGGASGGGVFDERGQLIGALLGGVGDEMQHARVELFQNQWADLIDGSPVGENGQSPLAGTSAMQNRMVRSKRSHVAQVIVNDQQVALGTLMGSNIVVTKASVLKTPIRCRFSDGSESSATVQRESPTYDLAVLRLDGPSRESNWKTGEEAIVVGSIVSAVLPKQAARTGIVSWTPVAKAADHDGNQKSDGDQEQFETRISIDVRIGKFHVGAPVVDIQGRMTGVIADSQTQYGGFAQHWLVPIKTVLELIKDN